MTKIFSQQKKIYFFSVCPIYVQYYSNCSYLCLFCAGLCFEMYSTDTQREGCELFPVLNLLFCVIQEGGYLVFGLFLLRSV